MSRNVAICLSLITAALTLAFTSLVHIPKGNAQYNTFSYNPLLYPSYNPLLYPSITRLDRQSLSIQPFIPPAAAVSSSGVYGLYYFPQGALNLSPANGLSSPYGSPASRASSFNSPALRFSSSSFFDSSTLAGSSYPTSPLTSAFSLANLGNYAASPLLGLGPFASLSAAASFAGPQGLAGLAGIAGLQGFQPLPALPYSALPYATLQGSLISWPGAEVLIPAVSPVAPIYYTYTVVNVYPHDKTAFTEGLVYDNGFLYEGTGIPGRSQVRREDLLTGTVLQSVDLPSPYFGEGITIFGNTIIELTWQSNIGFVYDKLTFALLQTFSYPTEGWGLTHNGKNLIMSDGTATLHFLDPVTFAEVSSLDVYDENGPVPLLNELEYIKGEIYANVWLTDRIARISPVTGQVVGWIDLTGLLSPADIVFPIDVLNGIAYDAKNDRLFVTGKLWPKLFEIDLVPLP